MGRALTILALAAFLVIPTGGQAEDLNDIGAESLRQETPETGEGSIVAAQVATSLVRDARRQQSRGRVESTRAAMVVPASLPLAVAMIGSVLGLHAKLRRRPRAKRRPVSQPPALPRRKRSAPLRSTPDVPALARVLIVDDSPTTRAHLQAILQGAAGLQVIGLANDGLEALSLAFLLRPDVIVMDLEMPEMNGIEATARIMKEAPTAVAAVSSHFDVYDPCVSGKALGAGAVALLAKPPAPDAADYERSVRMFADTIAAVSRPQASRRAA